MSQKVAQPELREVLRVVAEKGATYATEVKWNSSIDSIRQAGEILHTLESNGVLERLTPTMKGNDSRLINRKTDMWMDDDKGIGDFRNKKWYGLNSELNWELKVEGSDKYVDEYHNTLSYGERVPEDKKKGLVEKASEMINS